MIQLRLKGFRFSLLFLTGFAQLWIGSALAQSNEYFNFDIYGGLAAPISTPDIDSNMDIRGLSNESYIQLLEDMYKLDQKYRAMYQNRISSLADSKQSGDTLALEYFRKMCLNDTAIQKLLLRLFKAYGWPKDVSEEHSISLHIWIIIWHSPIDKVKLFYEYLYFAFTQGYIGKNSLTQIEKYLNTGRRILTPK